MASDRPACSAGDDKVVLAELRGVKWASHHFERPFDTAALSCGLELMLCSFGNGAEMILDMILGQWLKTGA